VLLQIVTNPGNIGSDFNAIRQADARHLAQCGVWLLWRLRIHAGANTAPLRASLQSRARGLVPWCRPAFPDQLTECRQEQSPLLLCCSYPKNTVIPTEVLAAGENAVEGTCVFFPNPRKNSVILSGAKDLAVSFLVSHKLLARHFAD
jgi:hypothetical protein